MFASSVVLYCIFRSWPWLLPLSISAAGNDNNRTRNTTIGAVVGSVLIFVIAVLLALSHWWAARRRLADGVQVLNLFFYITFALSTFTPPIDEGICISSYYVDECVIVELKSETINN